MLTYFERLDQAADFLAVMLQVYAPKRTGNLAINAIRKAYDGNNMPMIVIGGEIAPYAVYTNEPWLSEKWHGAVNPNEGWIQKAIEDAKPILIQMLSGVINESDLRSIIGDEKTNSVMNAQNYVTAATFGDIAFSELSYGAKSSYQSILQQQLDGLPK